MRLRLERKLHEINGEVSNSFPSNGNGNLRNEVYKLVRISKSNDDWKLFRQLRNKVVDECRKAKKNNLEF